MKRFKRARTFLIALVVPLIIANYAFAGSYTVASGDTLYTIGKLFNTTATAIKQDNKLSGDMIYPGQTLQVPSGTYTVKSGDTLYLIAKNNGVSLEDLRKTNNKWDNAIYPGEKLNLPGKVTGTNGQTSDSTVSRGTGGTISYTANDLDLLARLITSEADNQPYNAKVSVGAVVVNRVKDSRFPNTIRGVIYEVDNGYYQFTPVENGYIYKPASSDAKKAALEALQGVDPTHGAVYYFDDSATNKSLWSKPIALRVGNMVFTY